jgi:hypothetical protein
VGKAIKSAKTTIQENARIKANARAYAEKSLELFASNFTMESGSAPATPGDAVRIASNMTSVSDVGGASNFWGEVAAQGISDGGFWGGLKAFGAATMEGLIDVSGLARVQTGAQTWGTGLATGNTSQSWLGFSDVLSGGLQFGSLAYSGFGNVFTPSNSILGANSAFGSGGLLNSNRYLRIGWGKDAGYRVFRASGQLIPRFINKGHINMWWGPPL